MSTDTQGPEVELTSSPTRRIEERDEDTPMSRNFPPTGPTPTPESLHPIWVVGSVAAAALTLLVAYLLHTL